jgi:glycosyltransferase involved in cell wall biosynthesis
LSTLRVGFLTKRKDACYWLRILNPLAMLNQAGHVCEDEVFEQTLNCPRCNHGPYTVHWDMNEDVLCLSCREKVWDRKKQEEWKQSVLGVIDRNDIVVFQRPTELSHLRLIRLANEKKKITVQAADDNYIDVPTWNSGYEYYTLRKKIVEATLREVDAIDVTTQPLKNLYSKYNKRVEILPNSIDIDVLDAMPEASDLRVFSKSGQLIPASEVAKMRLGKKMILWGGSPTHEKDLELIITAIRRLSRSEPVVFGFVGYVHRGILEVLSEKNLMLFGLVSNEVYYILYKGIHADIGLAPVAANSFNAGKSALKLHEYCGMRILPVVSNFDTYRGQAPYAFYAEDDNWFETIQQAIHCEDREARIDGNRKFVEEKFNINVNCVMWERFYEKLLGEVKK